MPSILPHPMVERNHAMVGEQHFSNGLTSEFSRWDGDSNRWLPLVTSGSLALQPAPFGCSEAAGMAFGCSQVSSGRSAAPCQCHTESNNQSSIFAILVFLFQSWHWVKGVLCCVPPHTFFPTRRKRKKHFSNPVIVFFCSQCLTHDDHIVPTKQAGRRAHD